jgi:hypothetical protein
MHQALAGTAGRSYLPQLKVFFEFIPLNVGSYSLQGWAHLQGRTHRCAVSSEPSPPLDPRFHLPSVQFGTACMNGLHASRQPCCAGFRDFLLRARNFMDCPVWCIYRRCPSAPALRRSGIDRRCLSAPALQHSRCIRVSWISSSSISVPAASASHRLLPSTLKRCLQCRVQVFYLPCAPCCHSTVTALLCSRHFTFGTAHLALGTPRSALGALHSALAFCTAQHLENILLGHVAFSLLVPDFAAIFASYSFFRPCSQAKSLCDLSDT